MGLQAPQNHLDKIRLASKVALTLSITLVPSDELDSSVREQVYDLCARAYEEDLRPLFAVYRPAVHLLGWWQGRLISHLMWVTRWLQVGEGPLLRTAYIENVATEPVFQRRGFASALMRRAAQEIADFDLGGLSPFSVDYYARLGWELWRGPLAIRTPQGLLPTPDEEVMILRLPRTPPLDLYAPLSAEWREGDLW